MSNLIWIFSIGIFLVGAFTNLYSFWYGLVGAVCLAVLGRFSRSMIFLYANLFIGLYSDSFLIFDSQII